jgi:Tol biopolymer transport system component
LSKTVVALVGILVLSAGLQGLWSAPQQDNPAVLLRAAIEKEEVVGDLNAAIEQYKQVVKIAGTDRAVAAQALLRLGGCYEKRGPEEARQAYQQLIRDYAEQTREVAAARSRLVALKSGPRESPSLPTLRLLWSGTDVDSSGAISPDGRLLAHVNWETGDLAVRELRLSQSHAVTSKTGGWQASSDFAFSPRWSPDGKRLAYYWYRQDANVSELRITDLSGKDVRVLHTEQGARGLAPAGWFPDGTALLATRVRAGRAIEIVRISLEDGVVSSLWKPGSIGSSRVCLSPNGNYVAFDESADADSLNMDVFVMPASGGRPVPAVTGPYDDRLLGWTPDGRRILVASNRSGAYDAWLIQVADGNVVGSPLLLRREFGMVTPIGFSPDGAFYFEPDLAVRNVMLADWDPESPTVASAPRSATEHFAGSTRLPAWSPDGGKLAYLVDRGSMRPAETRVRIRDLRTGIERTLADVHNVVYSLSWSPDGTSLAMTVSRTHSPGVCQILDVASGALNREFISPRSGEGIYNFVWGPGGDVAYYVAGGGSPPGSGTVLVRRNLRTGEEVPLHRREFVNPIYYAVSPDGQHLAVGNGPRIMIIAASGGEPRELVSKAPGRQASETLAWSPDGRYVYFGRQVPGAVKLYRVALTGGAPEDLNLEIGEELRFSPDGRHLAFTRLEGKASRSGGEIWVMENVLPVGDEPPTAPAQKPRK